MAASSLRAGRLTASLLLATLGASIGAPLTAEQAAATDPWSPLRPLVGRWRGVGQGLGGEAAVEHSYEFVLQGQYLHMRTRSVFAAGEDGTPGEVHEDWGLFSWDADHQRLVWRQFLSEGFVNTYHLAESTASGRRQVWDTIATEGAGGMAARVTWELNGEDAYMLLLELQPPGGELFECRRLELRREP